MTEATHTPIPAERGAFDVCAGCGQPIVQHWDRRETWVTMAGGSPACYPREAAS